MPKFNVNDFDQLYRRTIKSVSTDATAFRVSLNRIKAGKIRVLTHVTVENKTDGYTKCRLGINNGGNDHLLDELTDPEANELAVSRSDILLGEGDVFFAKLDGATVGDVIIMTCIGWEQSL